ncbi:Precursor of CEP6 [Cardamine amara subsp. amara]|uniref:Precursor of CEP6 n=1 Tax=Cardamine amara subsp. amara TaxID=228776 RepID=A0ABD0ZPI6_CARAN
MNLSIYITLNILLISTVFYKIQFSDARQLRKTENQDHDHHFTVGYTDDFGPTSPDEFKPTTPGYSPRVGHAVMNNNEPNA